MGAIKKGALGVMRRTLVFFDMREALKKLKHTHRTHAFDTYGVTS